MMKTGTPGLMPTSRRMSDLATRLIRTSVLSECRLPACLCSLERVLFSGRSCPGSGSWYSSKGQRTDVEDSNQDGWKPHAGTNLDGGNTPQIWDLRLY